MTVESFSTEPFMEPFGGWSVFMSGRIINATSAPIVLTAPNPEITYISASGLPGRPRPLQYMPEQLLGIGQTIAPGTTYQWTNSALVGGAEPRPVSATAKVGGWKWAGQENCPKPLA